MLKFESIRLLQILVHRLCTGLHTSYTGFMRLMRDLCVLLHRFCKFGTGLYMAYGLLYRKIAVKTKEFIVEPMIKVKLLSYC